MDEVVKKGLVKLPNGHSNDLEFVPCLRFLVCILCLLVLLVRTSAPPLSVGIGELLARRLACCLRAVTLTVAITRAGTLAVNNSSLWQETC